MSAIWIDPVELAAESALLGELGARVQETVTGTRTSCTCEVPRSLVGWLDEELRAITVEALTATVGLLLEAMELQLRADGVTAEQSLVAASPALTDIATGPGFAATTMGGFSAYGETPGPLATTMGGFSSYGEPAPAVATTGWGGPGYLAGEVQAAPAVPSTGWGNPGFVLNPYPGPGWQPLPLGLGLGASGIPDGNLAIRNITAPNGITFVDDHTIVDRSGRSGSLGQMVRNPETGQMEVL